MLDMTRGVCALCKHNKVIQCWPIEHGHGASTYNMAATETPPRLFRQTEQHGLMVAYICQACGFVMWFAVNAKDIPIGVDFRTKIVVGTPQP